jgi:hypothetical protein
MSDVRCKFRVHTIDKNSDGSGSVKLHPVYSGSPENEAFYKATPGGDITFYSINENAIGKFEVGKEYYVDFTAAE